MATTLGALGFIPALAAPLQADLHLDTPTQLLLRDLRWSAPTGLEAGLPQLRAGGTTVAVMVLWPGKRTDPKARTFALLQRMEEELAQEDVMLLTAPGDLNQLESRPDTMGVMLSLEGAHGLGDGPWEPVFDELVARGLRMLGVTWSTSNRFAGSSGDGGGGLTAEGRALVDRARRAGVLLDVSHASRQTTLELCRASPAPVVASHSDAAAVHDVPRNLTNDEIRCIARTGGVIGLNLHAPFVGGARNVAAVADHADHLAAIGGKTVVALGSDFDGFIETPAGLSTSADLPALWAELAHRGWTQAEIDGVRGGNFQRAWTLAWDRRAQ